MACVPHQHGGKSCERERNDDTGAIDEPWSRAIRAAGRTVRRHDLTRPTDFSTSVTRTVNGDYTPIAGHFNNDNCTDVLWYDPTTDELLVWRSNCDGSFTAQASHAVPSRSYPVGYGIGY